MTDRAAAHGKNLRLFFSHSGDDADFARRLASRLRNAGFETFIDIDDIQPGENWSKAILRALEMSDKLIFIVPSREGSGKNALIELGAARALGKPILAVMPDSSRAWNSEVARAISNSAVLDASRLDDRNLVDALAS
ncbi:MAG TPA: toll/interleukin-1 receptor domain-containing protein [Rhizobiaceae bacterium]